MRMIVLASLALVSLATGLLADTRPSEAQYAAQFYPYCARYFGKIGGGSSCYFATLEQCREDVSGVGGYCTENPWYIGPPGRVATPVRKHRRKHYY
jgi:Protein of unknown function (DUF3551)